LQFRDSYSRLTLDREGCRLSISRPLKNQLSGKVDAAFLCLSALEDAAQGNLLPVASIWIILLPAAAKTPVVEASTGAARVVPNVAVLPVSTIGNAATARTVTSRRAR